jgi:NagD protein
VQLGYHTVLVLSGGTRAEVLDRYAYRPELVVDSLAELAALLDKTGWRPRWHAPAALRNGRRKPPAVARA